MTYIIFIFIGAAENLVRTFKNVLKKVISSNNN